MTNNRLRKMAGISIGRPLLQRSATTAASVASKRKLLARACAAALAGVVAVSSSCGGILPCVVAATQSAPTVDECIATDTGCDSTLCEERCGLHGARYLRDKCCAHAGVKASLLAFEKAEEWIPRIQEYNLCTGAEVRINYLLEGEDGMAEALLEDVGKSEDLDTGQGIHDAYIVQGPWLPPVFRGLKPLGEFIRENDEFIQFSDINQASRAAVSVDGEVVALPLDSDYIAMGWRQDVFNKHNQTYFEDKGEWLRVPSTIEELVETSEWLNGKDHNNDGEPDWGFCLTPQTNYFNAFVAPVLQTHLQECENMGGTYDCHRGADTGQNIFFDVDDFDPLIHNDGFRYAFELYWRFIRASNCQEQTPQGIKCDRKTAFPTGRCAGVISMPGTLTKMLQDGGKYAPSADLIMSEYLEEGQYWGRRAVFPGSRRVVDWTSPDRPLVDCAGVKCPLAKDGINFAPFFSEGGEAYALNGRQSKPKATVAMWDMFTWLAELPINLLPLSGVYRNSHLQDDFVKILADQWNSTIMADDLRDVLREYFKSESEGGNPVQDLLMLGFDQYNDVLNLELHTNLVLRNISDGGLFDLTNPSQSLNPVDDKEQFDERYNRFIRNLNERYDSINRNMNGGALHQLVLWRESLDLRPKDESDLCQDLLATNQLKFRELNCLNVVNLQDLCQNQYDDVEDFKPGACPGDNNNYINVIIIVFSIFGAGIVAGIIYFIYKRYRTYQSILQAHEHLMEATVNEAIRVLQQLDYPLHLIRGDEFLACGNLIRHEVLRNTHKLNVLDSLSDVDAFIDDGNNVVFFSHQWTSFTAPDPSNKQYRSMTTSLSELARRSGWDPTLRNVFVWVDFSCIPQANPSTQMLAIRSLAAYASSATYFIICAPDTKHADSDDTCDLGTYQRRMWCRAEQVCHSMRNGTDKMYVTNMVIGENGGNSGDSTAAGLVVVEDDFFHESLRVFDGDLTCCRLEHKGMSACDRQSLVLPLLGLYGELHRASMEGIKGTRVSVDAFLSEIEENQNDIFPRTFERVSWRKGKRIVEEVLLFGDLIDRMRTRVKSGAGFAVDDGAAQTSNSMGTAASTGSDFVRHGAGGPATGVGASDFIRHGIVHGSGSKKGSLPVVVETAVGGLSDHIDQ